LYSSEEEVQNPFTKDSSLRPTRKRKAMSEIVDKKRKARKAEETVPVQEGPIEVEELEGFTSEEVARLLKVKQDIASGRYSDITNEHRKLLFVQWMVEHGRLES
jgi:hypothetical protein